MHCRFLALLLCLPIYVQAHESSVKLEPTWQVGEQVQYDITSSKSSEREGTPPSAGTSKSFARIRVLRSTSGGSTHDWRFETQAFPDQPPASGVAEKLLQILRSFSMQLQLDEDAFIVGIANAAEVRTALQSTVEVLFEARPDATQAAAQREQFQRMIDSLVSDDRRLVQVVTKEAQLVYSPIGGEYEFGSSRRVKGSTVTPFSSEAVATDNEITVSPLNELAGTYKITLTETPDPEGVARLVDELLGQMSKAAGAKAPSMKDLNIRLRRTAVYEMSLSSSWPLTVQWTQTAAAGTTLKKESIQLTRRSLARQP